MTVFSSDPQLATDQPEDGNLEFWSLNYGKVNAANVPNADGGRYDHGDQPNENGNYGSMQVHLPGRSQTVFALNGWQRGETADLGLGNQPAGESDWTFAKNAGDYSVKTLNIYIRPK